MSHPPPRRCRAPRDKANDRHVVALFDIGGRFFFSGAADLADHHDRIGFRVVLKKCQRVHKARTDNWVAANADSSGLA